MIKTILFIILFFSSTIQASSNVVLTQKEKDFIKNHPTITLGTGDTWAPYVMKDKNGKHIGMVAEYFKILQKEIDIPIKVIKTQSWEETLKFAMSRKCDIISLAMKTEKYLTMIDNNVLISSSDIDGNITYISKALCKLTGYSKEELIGKNHSIFRHIDMPDSAFKDMWDTIQSGKSWQGEVKNLNKDGSHYWANVKINIDHYEDKTPKGYTAIRDDITDKKQLEKISITDSLTKIPNRRYLDENYEIELNRAKRYENLFSIIILDIDLFKDVNDAYGHQVGDDILVKVAKLLKENIRSTDILGRWGGEEFLIISPETDIEEAKNLALKLKDKIEYFDFPIVRSITCSFGLSQYIQKNEDDDTFKRADKALYKAKKSDRNRVITH